MAGDVQWDQVKGWQDYWDWGKRQFIADGIDSAEYIRIKDLCKQKIKGLTVPPE